VHINFNYDDLKIIKKDKKMENKIMFMPQGRGRGRGRGNCRTQNRRRDENFGRGMCRRYGMNRQDQDIQTDAQQRMGRGRQNRQN